MRILILGLVAGLLLPSAAARADKPQTARPKDGDYVKVEARGTVWKSSQAASTQQEVFVRPPNICAGSYFFEKDVERYKAELELAKVLRPRNPWQPQPAAKATYSLRVRDGGEWELDIDDRFADLFDRQVGKHITIVGTVKGKRARVVSVNGLTLE
jgi:hypothetical protein